MNIKETYEVKKRSRPDSIPLISSRADRPPSFPCLVYGHVITIEDAVCSNA